MNRVKIITFLIAILLFNNSEAQNFGFNGKKNTFSFFSTGGIRVFPMALGFTGIGSGSTTLKTNKYSSSNQMKRKTVVARYDLRASYTRLINKKIGIGVEFGYEKFGLPMETFAEELDEYGYYYLVPNNQSTPVFNVFSYMLVFEFHSVNGAAPIGLSSSIGIGPKFYSFDYKQNYRIDKSTKMSNPYPKGESDIKAINLFYQLNYKKVLNKVMTFDVGMRLHMGVVLPESGTTSGSSSYSKSQLRDELFVHNLASLVSLRMGFSVML